MNWCSTYTDNRLCVSNRYNICVNSMLMNVGLVGTIRGWSYRSEFELVHAFEFYREISKSIWIWDLLEIRTAGTKTGSRMCSKERTSTGVSNFHLVLLVPWNFISVSSCKIVDALLIALYYRAIAITITCIV